MAQWRLESSLTTAAEGQQLAQSVLATMRADSVELDFAAVEVCTPSFANAFVMTLLASVTVAELKAHTTMINRSHAVAEMLNRSAVRYKSGIRLSNQRVQAMA